MIYTDNKILAKDINEQLKLKQFDGVKIVTHFPEATTWTPKLFVTRSDVYFYDKDDELLHSWTYNEINDKWLDKFLKENPNCAHCGLSFDLYKKEFHGDWTYEYSSTICRTFYLMELEEEDYDDSSSEDLDFHDSDDDREMYVEEEDEES